MLATRETAPMMGQSELTLDDSSLTHATADALSALRHWGEKLVGPRGWSKQDSTGSLDENGKVIAGDVDNPNLTDAERDNILYRDKVYMSTRYKIRDVMGDIYGHAVCNGVPNRVVNFFLIATITLSILFFVADSFNMSSSVAQCNVRNNTNLLAEIAAGNITCRTQVFEFCGETCFTVMEGIFTHIFISELIVNCAVAESYFRKRNWNGLCVAWWWWWWQCGQERMWEGIWKCVTPLTEWQCDLAWRLVVVVAVRCCRTDRCLLLGPSVPSFHSIPFHALHCIPFHCIPFHCIPFHFIPFHFI